MKLFRSIIPTPIGDLVAIVSTTELYQLEFSDTIDSDYLSKNLTVDIVDEEVDLHLQISSELNQYFNGKLKEFSIPLELIGTPFQKDVWQALLDVPYGETRSYMEQSIILGDPKAIRAVGTANGRNKIAIIIPCHRIIGSDGKMTGYAGGIERKKQLLLLERNNTKQFDLFDN